MVTEKEVKGIALLADIEMPVEQLGLFTTQFNEILEYFDLLDQVDAGVSSTPDLTNVFRDDEPEAMLTNDEATGNAGASEDGFIKAPRVM
jgi:aspartyl-tRNA(Asn)/glutamyl-tRNA(Gln) amidotransferase subunit C